MENKEFNKLLELWKKEKISRAKGVLPDKGKDCLFFTEFEAYVNNGCQALTAVQKQHIESCSYCQKMIATFKEAAQGEKQPIPIYERLTLPFKNLVRLIGKVELPRLTPVLAPVLAAIILFITLSNQPLELKDYSLEFAPTIKTRSMQTRVDKAFRIRIVTNYNCYVYLFNIKKRGINLLTQEKVAKKVRNIFPKESWFEGEGNLVLLLSKKPLKDISCVKEIIAKNYEKGEKHTLATLRKELNRRDLSFYNIKSPQSGL